MPPARKTRWRVPPGSRSEAGGEVPASASEPERGAGHTLKRALGLYMICSNECGVEQSGSSSGS